MRYRSSTLVPIVISALCALRVLQGWAAAPTFDKLWPVTASDYSIGVPHCVVEADGTMYVAGNVPSKGIALDKAIDPGVSFFLLKADRNGHVLWSTQMPLVDTRCCEYPEFSIALDSNGGVLVFGEFAGNLTLPDGRVVSAMPLETLLLVKFRKDNGAVVWANEIPGRYGYDRGLLVDGNNDVLVNTSFRSAQLGGIGITAEGPLDCVTAKFSNDGDLLWLHQTGGDVEDWAGPLAMRGGGGYYAAGLYESAQVVLDKQHPVFSGQSSAVRFGVLAWAQDGKLDWSVFPEGPTYGIAGIAPAPDGSLWMAGSYSQSLRLGGMSLTDSSGNPKGFLANVDQAGNARLLKSLAVSGGPIAVSVSGTVYGLTGTGAAYEIDAFSSAAEPLWTKPLTPQINKATVSISPEGNLFLSGRVYPSGRFDSLTPTTLNADLNGFIARLPLGEDRRLPIITKAPLPTNLTVGQAFSLSVDFTANLPTAIQWYFRDQVLPDETNKTFSLRHVALTDGGPYFVQLHNAAGTTRSLEVDVSVADVRAVVTTLAGNGQAGYTDWVDGSEARFYQPNGIAYLPNGSMLVADGWNHLVRLLDSSGATATYAGQNSPGYVDSTGRASKFNFPLGITVERSLDALVADYGNHLVRRINAFGLRNVSTVAGSIRGYKDGPALEAQFDSPNDLVVNAAGDIFVTEFKNHTVRRISSDGTVSTFAGSGASGYRDGSGKAAQFDSPGGIAIDRSGNLYITEWFGNRIRKITPTGLVSTLAGTNQSGFQDGQGMSARFKQPDGITVDPDGNLFITEVGNHAVRKVDKDGNVSTVAGLGVAGFQDGDRASAKFNGPGGIMWHPNGSLYVSDTLNNAIRRIDFVVDGTSAQMPTISLAMHPAITVFGQVGKSYQIQAAEVTSPPLQWVTLDTVVVTNASSVLTWFDPEPGLRRKRLYRAVLVR